MNKDKKTINKKKQDIKQPQISIFMVLFVVIIVTAIVFAFIGIRYLVITLKYKQYTDKIYDYGYNVLYQNEKATATNKALNIDMLKLVIGAIQNTTDIKNLYYTQRNKDLDINWIEYSKYLGISDKITVENKKDRATKADAAILATKLVEAMFEDEIKESELKMSQKSLSRYTQDEQKYIAKAVTLGILKNKNSELKQGKMLKGELNKMVIEIVEKYNTIYYKTIAMDSNEQEKVNLVTEQEKLPSNYKDYPYIVDNIDKEIYELEYNVLTAYNFKTPKQAYQRMGHLYMQIDEMVTEYFEEILNIDYSNISIDSFLKAINPYVAYRLHEEDVEEYVNYVKENEIKLEGKATPLLPIMYNNGEQYMIRTKVEFKVVNSNTEYNLLFGDEGQKVKYTGNSIIVYIDVPTGMTINAMSLRIYVTSLSNYIVKDTKQLIKNEIGG